jgi:hypothetical protein
MVLIFQKLLPKPNWAHLTMFSKRKQENKRRKSSQFVFVLQNYVAFLKTNERNVIYNGILNLCTHREILVLFDRSISTIWWFDNKITKIIERKLQDFIKWPTVEEVPVIEHSFQQIAGFPGVIGAMDGTYIEIVKPSENQKDYNNRQMRHPQNDENLEMCKYSNQYF